VEGLTKRTGEVLAAVAADTLRRPPAVLPWAAAGLVWLIAPHLAPAVVAAALLGNLALIVGALRRPDALRDALRGRRAARARGRLRDLFEDAARIDATTRARLETVINAFDAVNAAAGSGGGGDDIPAYVRASLADTVTRMVQIAERTAALVESRAEMCRRMDSVSPSQAAAHRASLRGRRDGAADPDLRMQLDLSLRFKDEEIASYAAIERAIRRIDGQIETVVCAFAALQARVLQWKGDDPLEWPAVDADLRDEIGALSAQMDALDASVQEVLAAAAPGRADGNGSGGRSGATEIRRVNATRGDVYQG
jgi:hypothetical protein